MAGTLNLIAVEVAYAEADHADCTALTLPAETTVASAITQSGLLLRHPEISLNEAGIGIFGRLRGLDDLIRDGDRIEIYRQLQADPKQARRQRVKIARRKTR